MTRKRNTPPSELHHRWFFAEWAASKGKIQADAQKELGWSKSSASKLWNGKQRYTQDIIDQVSTWLEIQAYELLLPPKEAQALNRLREAAHAIAAEDAAPLLREGALDANGTTQAKPIRRAAARP